MRAAIPVRARVANTNLCDMHVGMRNFAIAFAHGHSSIIGHPADDGLGRFVASPEALAAVRPSLCIPCAHAHALLAHLNPSNEERLP